MYPSLVNCTTIDWFSEWPHEALLEVAERYLENMELGDEEVSMLLSPRYFTCSVSSAIHMTWCFVSWYISITILTTPSWDGC